MLCKGQIDRCLPETPLFCLKSDQPATDRQGLIVSGSSSGTCQSSSGRSEILFELSPFGLFLSVLVRFRVLIGPGR